MNGSDGSGFVSRWPSISIDVTIPLLKSSSEYKYTAPVESPTSFNASFAPTARRERSLEQSVVRPNWDKDCVPSLLRELLYLRSGSNNIVELIVGRAERVELIVGKAK